MITSWTVILKRFAVVGLVALVLLGIVELFAFDIIKINWPGFMEIQPSHRQMRDPLPVPAQSIPVEGPAYILSVGVPVNPVPADAASIARGQELFRINCAMCHGPNGEGNGPIANYLKNKPANLPGLAVQSLSDGGIFMTISNGVAGKMPALNENLTVRERWDVVNYVRTLRK